MDRRAPFYSLFVFKVCCPFLMKHQTFPRRFVYLFVVIRNLQPARFCLFACQSMGLLGWRCMCSAACINFWLDQLDSFCMQWDTEGRVSSPVAHLEMRLLNDICCDFYFFFLLYRPPIRSLIFASLWSVRLLTVPYCGQIAYVVLTKILFFSLALFINPSTAFLAPCWYVKGQLSTA